MMMFVVPLVESECAIVGWVTMIGVGESTVTIAAAAIALTGDVLRPRGGG